MTPSRALLVTVTLCAAAACTEQADVAPTTVDPSSAVDEVAVATAPADEPTATGPTTSSIEPQPTTTVPAPSTTTAPAPTSTVAPTTTIGVGTPTSASTEYFLGGEPNAWLYLGRWTGNDWESDRDDDQQLREPSASNGDEVTIQELDIAPIAGSVEGSGEACSDGRTGPVITPNARTPDEPGFGYRSLAFAADWQTRPRPVATVDVTVDEYLDAGASAFDDLEVDTASGEIDQIVVGDLDGDGDSESLVAYGGDDFSALLLIDTDSGASTTVARSAAVDVEPAIVAGETYRVMALADLNGDGRYEIAVHGYDDDSGTVTVNTYDGTEVTAVLSAGC